MWSQDAVTGLACFHFFSSYGSRGVVSFYVGLEMIVTVTGSSNDLSTCWIAHFIAIMPLGRCKW